MFFKNKYKYRYLILSFCNDGFYIEDVSKYGTFDYPFFYRLNVNRLFSPSKDYQIFVKDNQLYLGLKNKIDFSKPYLYQ